MLLGITPFRKGNTSLGVWRRTGDERSLGDERNRAERCKEDCGGHSRDTTPDDEKVSPFDGVLHKIPKMLLSKEPPKKPRGCR